jgi:hypothetical protein
VRRPEAAQAAARRGVVFVRRQQRERIQVPARRGRGEPARAGTAQALRRRTTPARSLRCWTRTAPPRPAGQPTPSPTCCCKRRERCSSFGVQGSGAGVAAGRTDGRRDHRRRAVPASHVVPLLLLSGSLGCVSRVPPVSAPVLGIGELRQPSPAPLPCSRLAYRAHCGCRLPSDDQSTALLPRCCSTRGRASMRAVGWRTAALPRARLPPVKGASRCSGTSAL